MTLIKRAKANWHYRCELCDYTSRRSPDPSGAELSGIRHERGRQHLLNLMREAVVPVQQAIDIATDAFTTLAKTVTESVVPALDMLTAAFAPPRNTPHDPTIRADRRRW